MLTPTNLAALRAHHVPGDLWADVLAKYEGAAMATVYGRPERVTMLRTAGPKEAILATASGVGAHPVKSIRLPLTHRLARAHVAHILSAGLKCERCRGSGVYQMTCSCFDGYLRKPSPAWHMLPADECAGGLPPELAEYAPALLACHVARVAAGLGGVEDVLSSINLDRSEAWSSKHRGFVHVSRALLDVARRTCALRTPDGVTLPWPEPTTLAADGREKES